MAGQPRWQSALETAVNIVIGYSINFVANLVVLPLFGFHITLLANIYMGIAYTGISIVRSYVLRRAFNAWHVRHPIR